MYDEYKRFCIIRKTKADKLKLFKNRIITITPSYKERYVYKDDNDLKKDITCVVLHIKLKNNDEI